MSYFSIFIWVAVIAAFGWLWWQGHIRKFALYVRETRVELEKCAWPTWDELKGSTLLVFISIALLGIFTVVIDRILFQLFIKL